MSDPDRRSRGGEPPLTLDKNRAPRPRGPAPVTLIVSVLILAVVVGGVLWLYRGGVRGGGGSPPTIDAPAGAARTAAPAQATAPDASAGLSIYKDNGAAASSSPTFAPPPEQPGARPTAPAPASTPAPAANAAPAAAMAPRARSADEIGDLLDKPAPPPAKTLKAPMVAKTMAEKPANAGVAKTPIVKSPAAAAETTLASGPAEVQIGAYSTRAQADQGWSAAAAAAPGGMAGRGKKVEEVSKDGKTLYRTSITGFTSREAAQALCARLQAAGRSCFVR